MTGPLQPDLFGVVHAEAKDLVPGQRVRRPRGPSFTVTSVMDLGTGGILVRGKNTRHGGLVEIGCRHDTKFEVLS